MSWNMLSCRHGDWNLVLSRRTEVRGGSWSLRRFLGPIRGASPNRRSVGALGFSSIENLQTFILLPVYRLFLPILMSLSDPSERSGNLNSRDLYTFPLALQPFPFYCRPEKQCLNQAWALSAEMQSRASVRA